MTSRPAPAVAEHMLADPQIALLGRLTRYVMGEDTTRTFNRWFVPFSWGSDQWRDTNASELAARVELALAEFSNGHLTEAEFRAELRSMLSTVSWSLRLGPEVAALPAFRASSAIRPQEQSLVVPTVSVTAEADTRLLSVA